MSDSTFALILLVYVVIIVAWIFKEEHTND
jgi:hypothetical protein